MSEKPGKAAKAAADFPPKESTVIELALREAGVENAEITPVELTQIYGEKVPKRALEAFKKLKSPEKIESFLKLKAAEEEEKKRKAVEKKTVRRKGRPSSKRKPKAAPTVQTGKAEPFDPHSVASAMTIEDQQRAQEIRKQVAIDGGIPKDAVLLPDVDIDEARAPHLASDTLIKAISQAEMDVLADSEPIPPDASIRKTSQAEMDALVASPEVAALEAVEAEVQRQIVENRKARSAGQSNIDTQKLDIGFTEPEAGISNKEGTPQEWRAKLKGLIMGAKEKVSWYTSSSEKLIRRNEELDAQGEKISGGERLFRALGEKYNKMGWKSKLALGASLGLGAGISVAAASVPAMIWFVGLVGAQRAAGLASMYMKFEKAAPHGEKRGEKFWQWGEKEKAMAKAILYTAGMTAGMAYAIKEISETEMAHRTQQWLSDTFSKIYGAISGGTDGAPTPSFETEMDTGMRAEPTDSDSFGPAAHAEAPAQAPAASEAAQYKYGLQAEVRYSDMQHAEVPPTAEIAAARAPEVAPKAPLAAAEFHQPATAAGGPEPIGRLGGADGYTGTEPEPVAASAITEGQRVGIDDDTRRKAIEWVAAQEKATEAAPLTAAAPAEAAQAGTPTEVAESILTKEPPIEIKTPPAEGSFDLTSEQDAQQKIFDAANQPPAPVEMTAGLDTKVEVEAGANSIIAPTEVIGAFTNANGVSIDSTQTQIFQAEGGATLAFGGTPDAQLNVAQDFAKAHPDTSVFVQADKPVLYEGKLTPFVYEVRYNKGTFGIGSGIEILGADGPTDVSHIGALDPKTFITKIDTTAVPTPSIEALAPTPTVVEPEAPLVSTGAPNQVEVVPEAAASEVGSVSDKVLNTLSTEQLDKMMTPEIAQVAEAQKSEMLALFDGGFLEKGVDSPTWKAVSNKPVEFLLAVNNSSIMKNLYETGRVDMKYLGRPVAFAQEVLGIERDASSAGISEKFGKIHSYLQDLAVGTSSDKIPFLPRETVAEYVARASKVLALKK